MMKTWIKVLLVFLVIGGGGAAAYRPAAQYWKKRNQPVWRTAEVKRGRIVADVNSTGTIKPVLSVQVGSFVSGPIEKLHVDFNQEVKKDDVLAEIDPRIYIAKEKGAKAVLATAQAEVKRAEALLHQAQNDQRRAEALRDENEDFISDAEMDQYKFSRLSLKAQLEVAGASVDQAEASLENAQANVDYTKIRSPVDGIIIDRKIDPGQTLAAQFQTPELFVIAPDMRKKMHVHALVDEADIGLIRRAKDRGQPVNFWVHAYLDDLFEGVIEEIRFSSMETQNVVTYPVIVAAPNPELKLLPGMTADISFRVDERDDAINIPNAALRFYPQQKHVRKQDHALLEGADWDQNEQYGPETVLSAEQKARARQRRNRHHVWVVEGEKLKAVEVVIGISDGRYSELASGDLKEGQKLVTGVEPKKTFGG